MIRYLLAAGCLAAVGCASTPKPAQTPDAPPAPAPAVEGKAAPSLRSNYLTPAEVMRRIEDSPVQYRLEPKDSPPGGWAEQLWPQRVAPALMPRVVTRDGQRVIEEWPQEPKVGPLLAQAEEHYEARRFAEAAKFYEQAVALCPDCYMARAYLGDATLFGGDAAGALVHYQKATELNPHDYRLYYFQGNTLVRLGRYQEALDAWAWSLVLNPRNAIIRKFFEAQAGLGLGIRGDVLIPRGFARKDGEEVAVEFDPDYGAAWLAYANCKALWIGEPSHRREMTGSDDHHFTSAEETECLLSAAMIHEGQKEQKTDGPTDPSLDRVVDIIQAGMITELVLFELAARVHPQYTLTLEDEDRQRLKQYVLKYVLRPVREH